ncbi:MAG: SAM-dependent methyltransferase [Desulfobacteraceae bacterium]|nr:class I SAM-dependent methyltransferase [Desulfobacteraceae bacterium]MBC2754768.1 SAM-dependent methyltransferase [Desulfobacteraceae bacterium]
MLDPKLAAKYENQARMLANKVKKTYNHLRKRFARQNIDVFRLYDWDIPEIRAAVDWYAGHLVIAEYNRKQSTPEWLPMMGAALAEILDVPRENVHLKERRAGKQNGKRYERIDTTNKKIIMSERDLKFYVNPYDYIDTGLFSDHRNTRQMIREIAGDKDFLNLYCYTGTFSCYGAKGGARTTTSVDRSETAITWARENMDLNGITEQGNTLIQAHTFDFLEQAKKENLKFDLAVVDPPSYSTTRSRKAEFDILQDHPKLLFGVVELMRPEALIFFSTNHQNFEPRMETLAISDVAEITSLTIPEDYISKKKTIHRCWKIIV